MKRLLFFTLLASMFCIACNKDEVITVKPLPVITLDDEDGVYSVKCGKSITLTASVTNADSYAWLQDGKVVGTSSSFTFNATEVGTFYLTFRAENESGQSEEQIRIEVLELQSPVIGFAFDEQGVITLAVGREYTLSPDILHAEEASFEWLLDGKSVGSQATYTCSFSAVGEHDMTFKVTNDDDTAEQHITLRVVDRLAGRAFIEPQRNVSLGRTLYLTPTLSEFTEPSYLWAVNGVTTSTDKIFAFTPSAEGDYTITLTLTDIDGYTLSTDIAVKCCPLEGTYKRCPCNSSYELWTTVYEYMPAPGQFINEDKSGFDNITTAEQAITYAEQRLTDGKYLSLGGWGGYVVVGFDHSIPRTDGNEFSIAGNMFDGSSEAGIVWVMQDTNGNGLPDDEWYELKGSEWGSEQHSQNYAVTYYRPVAGGMNVLWRDNCHTEGRITRNNTHTHDYYYPAWVTEASYTLYGSRLAHNTSVDSAGKYTNNAYSWGYADNRGSDADDAATAGNAVKCYFSISNAVNKDGSDADLQYVDFVKVQSAINHVAGPLGEVSTEVLGIEDETM